MGVKAKVKRILGIHDHPLFSGEHSRNFWATRDETGPSSLEGYWEARTHPSRAALARAVASLDCESALEVGCHVGPVLSAILQERRMRLAGTDISNAALDFAKSHLPEVDFIQARADDLPFPDKSFDAVVTGGLLLCVGPEEIEKALSELVRVSRKWLVLDEPYDDDPRHATRQGHADRYPNTTYWIRNYPGLLRGRAEVVSYERLPPEQTSGHMNSVLILRIL